MPLNKSLKKVLIIGSGPIVIGQAAEFDYSGTQACKAIKEEGIETVLINSNPATIMTDSNVADKVYIQPLTLEALEKIIEKEKPDGILAGFGGQTALNLAMELYDNGILEENNVKLLGVDRDSIKKAEDRDLFKKVMENMGEPVLKSRIANNIDECNTFAKEYGFPIIIRPAYTLGGTGGGIAGDYTELMDICKRGLKSSPINQILLEQSVAGWKEIEYEVIRDSKNNSIIVCNMENIDPVGVHTGDSIVIAPSQTLRDKEYQELRRASIRIVSELNIQGGCNVQFALNPNNGEYAVIEVNPRVSRSSALASKAAGYPIAKISAKIAIGFTLNELKNSVTKTTSACFEPSLDYVVIKIPKWPFDKFNKSIRTLGTQMKATGEVMAIARTFESGLLKAITSLDGNLTGLRLPSIIKLNEKELDKKIMKCDDERIFALAEAMRRGRSIKELNEITKIDTWFLEGIKNIVIMERDLQNKKLDEDLLYQAEAMGFTDEEIKELSGTSKEDIKKLRDKYNIYPVYKMVDTCSGEFEAQTPYYYSCYETDDENIIHDGKKVIVLGSGPIRIGQGIEFDYCCVHGVWGLKKNGYQSIMINNNPETVSTDFDTSDKLYFESLYIDNVMNIIRSEKPEGVILQFGGQTSINLASKLHQEGVNILGTSFEAIDLAEDRNKFRNLLGELNIPTPIGSSVTDIDQALEIVKSLGYPVVVRPSYVIGGRSMEVVYDDESLVEYMKNAVALSSEYPVMIDKYIKGTEIEVDAICDGENILIPGIMEHIEKTGVHSGDSITVYPHISFGKEVEDQLITYTQMIVRRIGIKGLVNIQYVYDGKDVYVIEVNPRASRTVPILSKLTGVPMIQLAVDIMLGKKLNELSYGIGLMSKKDYYGVKVPVFSNEKLIDVDMYLNPEMKSTGEVLGIDEDLSKAIYKGFRGSGINIPQYGGIYVSLKEIDKLYGLEIVKKYKDLGFKIFASHGTGNYLRDNSIECEIVDLEETIELIKDEKIDIVINTPTRGNNPSKEGFRLRRIARENGVPMFTSLDTANIFISAINVKENNEGITYLSMKEYL